MVLVDATGHATYVERTLEDDAGDPDEAEWRLSTYEFDIRDTPDYCRRSEHKADFIHNTTPSVQSVFTWRHVRHMLNGGHVCVPNKSCGSWNVF